MKEFSIESQRPRIIHPGNGHLYTIAGLAITIKEPRVASQGSFSLYEALVPPHFALLPAHVHRQASEWFYVLNGTLAFTLDDETVMARTGTFVSIAPGVVHTFWNPTATAATMLGFRSRPDFATYLAGLMTLLGPAGWPPVDLTPLLTFATQFDQFSPDEAQELTGAQTCSV